MKTSDDYAPAVAVWQSGKVQRCNVKRALVLEPDAARHSVPCSCYWCRSYRIEVSKFKQRKAMETAA